MNENNGKQPQREFRAGTIVAAVWEDETVVSGRNVTQFSIRIQKRYRDERSGQWKTTTYFRPDDLPKLVLVANKVYEEVMLRCTAEEASARSTQN
jgi:hypothetical protein